MIRAITHPGAAKHCNTHYCFCINTEVVKIAKKKGSEHVVRDVHSMSVSYYSLPHTTCIPIFMHRKTNFQFLHRKTNFQFLTHGPRRPTSSKGRKPSTALHRSQSRPSPAVLAFFPPQPKKIKFPECRAVQLPSWGARSVIQHEVRVQTTTSF